MRTVDHHVTYHLPDADDVAARFRQYGPRARGEGADLLALVMTPEAAEAGRVLTDVLGLPAVTAIAAQASARRDGAISDTDKQFVGALVCTLMEANGYEKTNTKRAISVAGWNRGEVYRRAGSPATG